MSVPGNQMFVKYETSSTIARKGFTAFIHRIGINSYHQKFLKNQKNYIISSTVSTQIDLRRFIKISLFQDGGLSNFFFNFCPKSLLLGQKSGGLFEFCIGGGLIKSGSLLAWIW